MRVIFLLLLLVPIAAAEPLLEGTLRFGDSIDFVEVRFVDAEPFSPPEGDYRLSVIADGKVTFQQRLARSELVSFAVPVPPQADFVMVSDESGPAALYRTVDLCTESCPECVEYFSCTNESITGWVSSEEAVFDLDYSWLTGLAIIVIIVGVFSVVFGRMIRT